MLPKHTYRKKFYKVVMSGNKAGQDIEGLTALFAQSKFYPLALRDNWQACIGDMYSIAEWQELTEAAYLALKIELDELGADVEVAETYKFYVFDENIHRDNSASKVLLQMEEYALNLWAQAENIEEAYRLTILPCFRNSQAVRMYRKEGLCYFVYKQGPELFTYRTKFIKKSSHLLLEASLWENLAVFMHKNFWSAETWYSHYGDIGQIRDGEFFLFEGWKDGQHKLLDDHSPALGAVSEQAVQLFRAIKIHAVGESLGIQRKFLPSVL